MKVSIKPSFKHRISDAEVLLHRAEYIECFNSLCSNENDKIILMLYGIGGIGKTKILESIEKEAKKETNNVIVKSDFGGKEFSQYKVYENIIENFVKQKIKLKYLPLIFTIYWKKENPNIDFSESKLPFIEEGGFLGDLLGELIEGGESIALAGAGVNLVHKIYKKASKELTFSKKILTLLDTIKDKDSNTLLEYFHEFLEYDLEEINNKNNNKYIFLFDTYEKIDNSLVAEVDDIWIRNMIISLSKHNSFFIFAGREALIWDDVWNTYIDSKEISSLSKQNIVKMINNNDIYDDKFINSIAESSKGQVFYIDLAIKIYKNTSDKSTINLKNITTNEIFKKFKRDLSDQVLSIIEKLAVAKYFDIELYKYILDKFNITYPDSLSGDLMNYSFFKKSKDTYYMHDLMSESVELNMSEEELIKIHDVLSQWHNSKIELLDYKIINQDNINDFYKYMYHLINVNNNNLNLTDIYKNKIETTLEQSGQYKFLIKLTNSILPMVIDSEFENYLLMKKAIFYAKIDNVKDAVKAIEKLQYKSIVAKHLNYYYYILAYIEEQTLGNYSNVEQSKYNQIIGMYNRAIKYANDDVCTMAYIGLANTYRKRTHFTQAKKYLEKAKILAKKINNDSYMINIYEKNHFLCKKQNMFEEALKYALLSLDIKKETLHKNHIYMAKSYRNISNLLSSNDKYVKETKEYALKAIELNNSYYDNDEHIQQQMYSNLVKSLYKLGEIEIFLKTLPVYIEYEIIVLRLISHNIYEKKHLDLLLEQNLDSKSKILSRLAKFYTNINRNESFVYYKKALEFNIDSTQKASIYFHCAKLIENKNSIEAEKYYLLYLQETKNENSLKNIYKAHTYVFTFYYKQNKAKAAFFHANEQLDISVKMPFEREYEYLAYRSMNVIEKDTKKKEHYHNKQLEIAYAMNNINYIIDTLKNIFYIHVEDKDIDKQLEILVEQESILLSKNMYPFLDITYGIKAEIYKFLRDYENVALCYDKQIKLRKNGTDYIKLSKGYSFKAKMYSSNDNNYKYYLDKGYEVLLQHNEYEALYEYIEHYLYIYGITKNERIAYILKQLNIAKDIKNNSLVLKSLHKCCIFYEKDNNTVEVVKYLHEKVKYLTNNQNYNELDKTISKLIVLETNNRSSKLKEILKIKLETTLYLKNNLGDIYKRIKLYYNNSEITILFKSIIRNFIDNENIMEIVPLIDLYFKFVKNTKDKILYKEFWTFLHKQIKKIKKYEFAKQMDSLLYLQASKEYKISNTFSDIRFELSYMNNTKNFEKQDEIFSNAVKYYRNKDRTLYVKYRDKYNKFKDKMSNIYIVDGEILYSALKNTIENISVLETDNLENIFDKAREIISSIAQEEKFKEKLSTDGLHITYFKQVISAKITYFDEIKCGFPTLVDFLCFVTYGTKIKIIELDLNGCLNLRLAFTSNNEYEQRAYIENYTEYLHTSRNYAGLISHMQRKGDGVFVPLNRNLLYDTIDSLVINKDQINRLEIKEIILLITVNLEKKEYKELLISNIIYSLYNAGAFKINISLLDLSDQKLTLINDNTYELINLLKKYGKIKILDLNLLGEFKENDYDSLWLQN